LEAKRPAKPAAELPRASLQARSPGKSIGKTAPAAVKRSAPMNSKKSAPGRTTPGKSPRPNLDEARLLGLSETAIRRVERNPSLLSRLVDKLTK
jgi:hypothetical protein